MGETYADGLASPEPAVVEKTLAQLQARPHPFSRDSAYEMKGFFDDDDDGRSTTTKTETRKERVTLELPFADFFKPRKALNKVPTEPATGSASSVGPENASEVDDDGADVPQRKAFAFPLQGSAGVLRVPPQEPVPVVAPLPRPFRPTSGSDMVNFESGEETIDVLQPFVEVPAQVPAHVTTRDKAPQFSALVGAFEDSPNTLVIEIDEGTTQGPWDVQPKEFRSEEASADSVNTFATGFPAVLTAALSAPVAFVKEVAPALFSPCHHVRVLPSAQADMLSMDDGYEGDDDDGDLIYEVEGGDEGWSINQSAPKVGEEKVRRACCGR